MKRNKTKTEQSREEKKMLRTALARDKKTENLRIFRYDDYKSQKEFADDLRANGYRVLKIWNGYVSDIDVDYWEFLNR